MTVNKVSKYQQFTYKITKDNKVFIYCEGKQVTIVTKNQAIDLIEDLEFAGAEEQYDILSRIASTFKREHERDAKLKENY